jgi:hypothetical protein
MGQLTGLLGPLWASVTRPAPGLDTLLESVRIVDRTW